MEVITWDCKYFIPTRHRRKQKRKPTKRTKRTARA
nr:MAG TPA: hypothetical protein [Caudoviricetes sp.]